MIIHTPESAKALAFEAYIYGFAIVENYKAIFGFCVWKDSPQYGGFNSYLHGRVLFDSSFDTVVNANNDTLYSTTFADLRAEPLVISVPPTGDRYFVIQLVDMGTDNFAYIGTRATGKDGGNFVLVGPRFKGAFRNPADTQLIICPSDFVAIATRTAIGGPDDLDGVIAVQEQLQLRPLHDFLGEPAPRSAGDIDFPPYSAALYGSPDLLQYLSFLLEFHTIPDEERPLMERLSALNIGPYQKFNLADYDDEIQHAIMEGVREAHQAIEARGNDLGILIDGWLEIPPMGNYGTDYLFRSAVAWKFIYTNSPEEALYPIAEADADGNPFSGEHQHVLHFPAGQLPPVEAFWSITLYDSVTRLMIDNPIDRYSIGDRTPGIVYGEDGSLTIYIQRDAPVGHEANWLPAPEGRFYLNARAYMPAQEMLRGEYRLPPVRRV
ncbi:MAG: DUF1214 domain-containing protein [Thermomicrobiales bacterium]|nr:DUF1214 domain-containing protein [Thermomicrobiales bacterium]